MSPWELLDLEPSATATEIRRAYAVLLKQTRPEDDPAGFQRLRSAYETALALRQRQMAEAAAASEPQESVQPQRQSESEPRSALPQPPELDEIARDTIQIILAALERGDGQSAAVLLSAAVDKSLLPIAAEMALAERLLMVLLADRTVPTERLRDIAVQFNWYGITDVTRGRTAQAEQNLCARIDAELWLGGLRTQAKDWRFWIGDQGAGAARLLLGRGPMFLSWLLPPEPPLSAMAGQLMRHYRWIAPYFSESRLRDVQRLTQRMRKHTIWRPRTLAWLLVAAAGVGMLIQTNVNAILVILSLVFIARAPSSIRSVFLASMALFGLLWVNAFTGWISPNLSAPRTVDYTRPAEIRVPLLGTRPSDLRRRAEAGDPDAIDQLAQAYLKGDGGEHNDIEAVRWLKVGVDHDDPIAERILGFLYENGSVVQRDYVQARLLFSRCLVREVSCNTGLAYLYSEGLGTAQDFNEARRYNEIAARQGDATAQMNLGVMLREGQGGDRDPVQSFKWTKVAAIGKQLNAMSNLGWHYHMGLGVDPDDAKARAWLTTAAEAGNRLAMVNLVALKSDSDRTKADEIEAYRWLSLALRTNGFVPDLASVEREHARISERLTPDRRSEVDTEIAVWKPQALTTLPETDAEIPK